MVHLLRPVLQHSQNFLTSRRLVDELLDRSTISPGDTVLDIGAGRGLITERLAQRGSRVLAIEKDPDLAKALHARFADRRHISVHEADVLRYHLPRTDYKVFANIPFAITTQIVGKLTATRHPPLDCYLVMQREAAERFTGHPAGTLRAALLHPWFESSVVHVFRRSDFTPKPQVDVVMLRLQKRGPPLVPDCRAGLYRDFVTYCFTARRPCLRSTLSTLVERSQARSIATRLAIHTNDTPTALRPEQWPALFDAMRRSSSSDLVRVHGAERRLSSQQRRLHKVHRTRTPAQSRAS
jgi:23S rRNA (adenine-N6)-dimethyltransferase